MLHKSNGTMCRFTQVSHFHTADYTLVSMAKYGSHPLPKTKRHYVLHNDPWWINTLAIKLYDIYYTRAANKVKSEEQTTETR